MRRSATDMHVFPCSDVSDEARCLDSAGPNLQVGIARPGERAGAEQRAAQVSPRQQERPTTRFGGTASGAPSRKGHPPRATSRVRAGRPRRAAGSASPGRTSCAGRCGSRSAHPGRAGAQTRGGRQPTRRDRDGRRRSRPGGARHRRRGRAPRSRRACNSGGAARSAPARPGGRRRAPLHVHALEGEQPALVVDAEVAVGADPGRADDAMRGDEGRQRAPSAEGARRTSGTGNPASDASSP